MTQQPILVARPGHPPFELVSYYDGLAAHYPRAELATRDWCVRNVKPDWVCFDVGANVGVYTILLSRLARQGRVHAFEPTATIDMLRNNLDHNGCSNVTLHAKAIGREAGVLEEDIYRMWGAEAERMPYPFETIDTIADKLRLERLDLVKIDVDSFDFDVLQGAAKILARFDPILIVELNHALSRRQQSNTDAIEWLASQGYESAMVLDSDNFILSRERLPAAAPSARAFTLAFPIEAEHLVTVSPRKETEARAIVHGDAGIAEGEHQTRCDEIPAEAFYWNKRVTTARGQWSLAITAPISDFTDTPMHEDMAIDIFYRLRTGRAAFGILDEGLQEFIASEREARPSHGIGRITLRTHKGGDNPVFCVRNWSQTGAASEIDVLALRIRTGAGHDR